jgi:hypothetical protein
MKVHIRDSLKPGYAHCGVRLEGQPEREGDVQQMYHEHDVPYSPYGSRGEDLQAAFVRRWCQNCVNTALAWRR